MLLHDRMRENWINKFENRVDKLDRVSYFIYVNRKYFKIFFLTKRKKNINLFVIASLFSSHLHDVNTILTKRGANV